MVGVLVLMQPAFLQSVLVPQVQFLDRILDIPAMLLLQVQKLLIFRSCRSSGGRAMLGSTVATYSASARGWLLENSMFST